MATSTVLLDDADNTTAQAFGVGSEGATIWVSNGTADLKLDADTIASLVVGSPQVISRQVSDLTVVATADNTTVKVAQ